MSFGKWVLGGLLGGAIGATIWAGIVYSTHVEIGWLAWGMGALVGLGVRLAAGETVGPKPGLTAAVIAILTVYAAKFLTVYLIVSNLSTNVKIDVESMTSDLADQICRERAAKGLRINWIPGMTLETATKQQDYPPDVWKEATARWTKLGLAEQQQRMATRKKEMEAAMGALRGEIRSEAFKRSFGPLDLLWFFLATGTAFKLGSGLASE